MHFRLALHEIKALSLCFAIEFLLTYTLQMALKCTPSMLEIKLIHEIECALRDRVGHVWC